MKIKLLLVISLFVYTALLLPQKAGAQSNNILPCFNITNFSDTLLKLSQLTTLLSADFNGDGYADLATEYNNSGSSVWILSGDGKGSFSVAYTLTFTNSVTDIVSADFNNDGRPDLAAISDSGYVYIALWNGSVSAFSFSILTNPPNLGVVYYPFAICTGDFNGDKKTDLAVATYQNNPLTIFINTGVGVFNMSTLTGLSDPPDYICSGDFNKDGYADLATVNQAYGVIEFYLWNSSVSQFTTPPTKVGINVASDGITSGDFNGDGYADLAIIVYAYGNNVYLALWDTTNNSFSASTGNPYTAGGLPYNACSADFNKDGNADLAVVNDNNSVTVLPGNKSGVFGSPLSFGLSNNDLDAEGICSGDFNGDGLPDLAAAGSGGSYPLSVLLNFNKITVTGLEGPYCQNAADVTIKTNVNNVTFSGPGINATVFQPFAANLGINSVTFTYTNGGCSIHDTMDVMVIAGPTADTVQFPISPCVTATSINLKGVVTNATSGIWTATAGNGRLVVTDSTTTNPSAIYYVPKPAITSILTFQLITTGNGSCPADSFSVSIHPDRTKAAPIATAFAEGDTIFCKGESVVLKTPVGYVYQWLNGVTAITGATDTSYAATSPGAYKVVVANDDSTCPDTSTAITIKVNPLPPVSISGLKTEYCVSSSPVTLILSPSGGQFLSNYQVGISHPSPGNTVFTPEDFKGAQDSSKSVIIYQYQDDTTDCRNADTVTVTIYSAPVVSLIKKLWCYTVDSVKLNVKTEPTGGTLAYSGAGITDDGIFHPSQIGDGKYAATFIYTTLDSVCSGIFTDTLYVDKPNVKLGLSNAYCQNHPDTLVNISAYTGEFIFRDTAVFNYMGNGNLLIRPSLAKPFTSDSLSYTYTDSNGCATATTITFNPFPDQPKAASSADSICSGNTLNLTAADAESGLHYKWTGPALYADTVQNPSIAAIDSTMSGNFRVQAKNSFNCLSPSDSVFVFVKPSPPTPLLYIPLTTICNYNYDSAYIKVLSNTADYSHYNWYLNKGLISGEHQPLLWVPEGGYYTLEVSHSLNNCVTYVDTTLRQTSSPVPVVIGLNAPIDSALLCNTAQGVPLNYQWYVNNKTIIGQESKELTVYYNGIYSVFALYSESCGEFSATYIVNRYDFSSIARVATQTDSTIIISPPASGISILRNGSGANYIVEYTSATNDAITITVTTITGVTLLQKEVSTKANVRSETEINLDGLVPAMYILNAATSAQSQYAKIIVN